MAPPAALRLSAIAALLLLCAPTTFAAVTPGELITSIQMTTAKGRDLQSTAQSITIINGPLIIIGQGPFPQIIVGFKDIVTHLTSSIEAAKGSEAISDSDAIRAAEYAVKDLVRVHQALLNILIGKAGLFNAVPFIGQPVAGVLGQYKAAMDAFMFGIADLVPDSTKLIADQAMLLGATTEAAINAYQGLGLLRFWQ